MVGSENRFAGKQTWQCCHERRKEGDVVRTGPSSSSGAE